MEWPIFALLQMFLLMLSVCTALLLHIRTIQRQNLELREHEHLGELVDDKLVYYATVTRESYYHQGRITELINDGRLFRDLDTAPLDPGADRVMICGNPNMLVDLKAMLEAQGFKEGSSGSPAAFVIERAFADR